jgi:pilus assembly protein CpaD
MTSKTPTDRCPILRLLGAVVGLSAVLGGCTQTGGEIVTASVPSDYRQRHPIAGGTGTGLD